MANSNDFSENKPFDNSTSPPQFNINNSYMSKRNSRFRGATEVVGTYLNEDSYVPIPDKKKLSINSCQLSMAQSESSQQRVTTKKPSNFSFQPNGMKINGGVAEEDGRYLPELVINGSNLPHNIGRAESFKIDSHRELKSNASWVPKISYEY